MPEGDGGRFAIALVSRELAPFGGGGIGEYVAAAARTLSAIADITILTTDDFAAEHAELTAAGDPRVDYGGASVAFVEEPRTIEPFYSVVHRYSASVLERLRELYPFGGPDLIEFSDYLGEAFVTVQARTTGDPLLRETLIAVRLHTTSELCELLDGHLGEYRDLLERQVLHDADILLWPGGDVLETYRRYYGAPALADAVLARYPFTAGPDPPSPPPRQGPLRMLYFGRLERRKGVHNLITALMSVPADWHLTVLGADTPTGPLGTSMRARLELQSAGSPNVEFLSAIPHEDVAATIVEHDLVVLPSLWECWPYAALEALRLGVPLLTPAVGGFTELVQPGVTGWLSASASEADLYDALLGLVREPALVRERLRAPELSQAVQRLTDPREILAVYERELTQRTRTRPRLGRAPGEPEPLVSIVIPYFGMHSFIGETVASAFAQTYGRIEVIVVNDGSFAPEDRILAELATTYPLTVLTQPNRGLGAARNFGIGQSRGRYVFPLDADNVALPAFVARCVNVLESEQDVAYVTSWNRFVDVAGVPVGSPGCGYQPLGNRSPLVDRDNVAGDAAAVIRRRIFDRHHYAQELTSYEDWAFYRELHHAGLFGRVIPERLVDYRIRDGSLMRAVGLHHTQRLKGEMRALIREQEVRWPKSA